MREDIISKEKKVRACPFNLMFSCLIRVWGQWLFKSVGQDQHRYRVQVKAFSIIGLMCSLKHRRRHSEHANSRDDLSNYLWHSKRQWVEINGSKKEQSLGSGSMWHADCDEEKRMAFCRAVETVCRHHFPFTVILTSRSGCVVSYLDRRYMRLLCIRFAHCCLVSKLFFCHRLSLQIIYNFLRI